MFRHRVICRFDSSLLDTARHGRVDTRCDEPALFNSVRCKNDEVRLEAEDCKWMVGKLESIRGEFTFENWVC